METKNLRNGLTLRTFPDGTRQLACTDCGNWIHEGADATIRHSKRCETQTVQPAKPVRQPRTADGLSNQETLDAVKQGYLTSNQAMNRDF